MARERLNKAAVTFVKTEEPFATSTARLYKTQASVQMGLRERSIGLVTKRSRDSEMAANAVYNYSKLRTAGIQLLPATYRLASAGSDEVIMTDFEKGAKIAISGNYNPRFESEDIGSLAKSVDIDKFIESLEKLKRVVIVASQKGIEIPDLAYFALVPKNGGIEVPIEFVIADIDRVRFKSSAHLSDLLAENAVAARVFLQDCLFSSDDGEVREAANLSAVETAFDSWWRNLRAESGRISAAQR